MSTFNVACIQTTSSREVAANIEAAGTLIRQAADGGADFVLLPETVNLMEPKSALMREKAVPEADDPCLKAFQDLARETGIWLLAGSLVIVGEEGKTVNRSILIGPDGGVQARYDKIHMFDVDLGDGEYYRESKNYEPGSKAVTAELPWGRLGMSVCYDLRFPHLYRGLAKAGADFLSIPAAFTRPTGEAHWHVLQRARAIENGCYVFAAAQCGVHDSGRKTYGHSLIIDPWGQVLADGGDEVGIISADIDLGKVADARAKIPSLTHDRDIA
ncbi:MAG: carbon-nitrogen hydrolase family protein [Rhodospirillales bacterium]|nr:carbon-nitrogen hydrolase family protein [Alphaproteobacteria bacterium]MBL6948829.1 carbon-nitrogen hydrolase family protein [Rhodospirillales bacterium]